MTPAGVNTAPRQTGGSGCGVGVGPTSPQAIANSLLLQWFSQVNGPVMLVLLVSHSLSLVTHVAKPVALAQDSTVRAGWRQWLAAKSAGLRYDGQEQPWTVVVRSPPPASPPPAPPSGALPVEEQAAEANPPTMTSSAAHRRQCEERCGFPTIVFSTRRRFSADT